MLKTEPEITKAWKFQTPPLVSVVCITFNQVAYIKDTIHGFLIQETDFSFEILIHDDASTDGTVAIIREYAKNYPHLIKPIYQIENQFTKHGKNVFMLAIDKARGEYVALCEGDDYWTDPNKLQKQIDAMRKHPQCHISFHPARRKLIGVDAPNEAMALRAKQNKVFSMEDVILGGGDFCPTASLMIKRQSLCGLPDWFYNISVSDYFFQILGSWHGGMLYINEIMATYRANAVGSWSSRMQSADFIFNWHDKVNITIENIKVLTQNRYDRVFEHVQRGIKGEILKNSNIPIAERMLFYRKYRHKLGFKNKLLWHLATKLPMIYQVLLRLKRFALSSRT